MTSELVLGSDGRAYRYDTLAEFDLRVDPQVVAYISSDITEVDMA